MDELRVGVLLLFIALLSLVVTILWIVLPFILLGTNNRLDAIIRLMGKKDDSALSKKFETVSVHNEKSLESLAREGKLSFSGIAIQKKMDENEVKSQIIKLYEAKRQPRKKLKSFVP